MSGRTSSASERDRPRAIHFVVRRRAKVANEISVTRRPMNTTSGDGETPANAGYTASRSAHPPRKKAVAAKARSSREARRVRIAGTIPTAHQASPEPRETMRRASNVGGMGSRGPGVKRPPEAKMISVICAGIAVPQTFKVHRRLRIADDYGSGSGVDPSSRHSNRRRHLSRSLAFLLRPLLRPAVDALRHAAGLQR